MNPTPLVDASRTFNATSLVATIRMLPPLPDVAQQILDRFGDEFLSANEIAAIVECDPPISARLFALANSAYFGLPKPVTDMRQVVSRVLGPDTVRSLAFALAADRTFDLDSCTHFDSRRFWHRALNCAASARRISKVVTNMNSVDREFSYLTGLCHDLGLLAMACTQPGQVDRRLAQCESDSTISFDQLCLEQFGFTRKDVSYELALSWDMPEAVVSAYRDRAAQGSNETLLASVLEASVETSRYFEHDGKTADGTDLEFPALAAEALALKPEALEQAARGTERQRGATESALQVMVGG